MPPVSWAQRGEVTKKPCWPGFTFLTLHGELGDAAFVKEAPSASEFGKELDILVCCKTRTPGSPWSKQQAPVKSSKSVRSPLPPAALIKNQLLPHWFHSSSSLFRAPSAPSNSGFIMRLDTKAKTKAYNFICKCGCLSGIWWCHFTLQSLEKMW